MKSVILKLISLTLCVAMTFNLAITASAAPSRNTGTVKFLSEVALIEAESTEQANEILALLKKTENGGFEGMISLDLNNGGKTKVYLAYKSSTNVDDAITDLAVMNMNGDYTIGNYEQLLNETMNEYIAVAKDYRTMALEFKANYDAGELGARTAYRQMNYYYVEENGVKTYMGDYLLNFPQDETDFAKMLFSGNLNIITNLRALMSMAVGDREKTLADRISASYSAAKTDESIYSNSAYEEVAKQLRLQFEDLKKQLNNLPVELEKIEKDTELDAEIKADFKIVIQQNLDNAKAFYELLKEIPMEDTNLGDYVMNSTTIELQKLFPIVAAATTAEALMMEYKSFYTLLLYDVLEKGESALDEMLAEFEKDYEPISVYHGVQNDLTAGTIGVTGNAGLVSSSTGKSFIAGQNGDSGSTVLKNVGFSVLGAGGVASIIGGAAYLAVKKSAATAAYNSLKLAADTATQNFEHFSNSLKWYIRDYTQMVSTSYSSNIITQEGLYDAAITLYGSKIEHAKNQVVSAGRELDIANSNLAAASDKLTGAQIAMGSITIVLGAVMMGVSIWQLVKINSKYQPKYTEIPNNMVDVATVEGLGDRFINYKNVPSYYMNDGSLANRENDMNAYDGVQWVSLYYTKNYEAGYCLTTTADLIAEETVRSGYKGIHLFAHSSNYNLNSYCNREGAEKIYLAFKYSAKQKSAVTDVPSVIGTTFNTGTIAISAFAGFGVGIVLMLLVQVGKKRKMKAAVAAEAAETNDTAE